MEINPVDIAALVVVVILGLRAAVRGFVVEFLAVAGVLLGAVLGWLFSARLAELLSTWIGKGSLNQILAFALIFVATFLLMLLFRNALQNIVDGFELDFFDHILGAVVGVVEGLVLAFLLVYLLDLLKIPGFQEKMTASVTYGFFQPFLDQASTALNTVVPPAPTAGS